MIDVPKQEMARTSETSAVPIPLIVPLISDGEALFTNKPLVIFAVVLHDRKYKCISSLIIVYNYNYMHGVLHLLVDNTSINKSFE